ncbi:bypass of stop codon protein 6 [Aspergillus udagawae]|uniref:Bypass of stop codon protein 6 n=1 Tax=Aspergillus udagawae TaxID=91492 RepID=A0ABQ1AK57_9EURO|nr:bypass of stop codon protein 6 [Aspergillus udagawae]GFF83384.1 bypass of stop codon protein 6 [Aspergillus udagawae]
MLPLIMSTSRNSKVPEAEWEHYKEIIRSLWEIHTLAEVIKIMVDDHNFRATKNQFGKWLKIWGFRRYKTSDECRKVTTKVEKRRQTQKDSTVEYKGVPIPPKTLRKEISRHTTLTEFSQATNALTLATPEGFAIFTPLPINDQSMSVESNHGLEEVVTPATARPVFSLPPSFEEPNAFGQEKNLPVDAAILTEQVLYLSPSPAALLSFIENGMIAIKAPFPNAGSYQAVPAREQTEQEILRMRYLSGGGNFKQASEAQIALLQQIHRAETSVKFFSAMNDVFRGDALHFDTAELRFEEPLYTTARFVAHIVFLLEAPASRLSQDHEDQIKPLAFL